MDAELQKLIEAGKLTTKSAAQLEKLKPGTFCLHKSWGFGRVREWLIGDVLTEPEWKRWWESTRRALKASGAFSIPAKKSEPIQIRGEGVSHADELLAAFNKARQPKQQIAAAEQIIKSDEQFKEPEQQLQSIVIAIENADARNQRLHPELAFELIIARDDLLARVQSLHTTHIGLTLAKMILYEEKRLVTILPNLPEAKEKRVLQALPAALGPGWTERALHLMEATHGRMVAQIPRILNEAGQHAELRTMLERSIREHSATSEMLIWLCGEKQTWGELITPDLFAAILAALEREQHNSPGRASRLQRALVDDRELLGEMFKKTDVGLARDAMRRLQLTPLFDELTKRSLLARMVKVYPELESMIAGAQPEEKAAPLIVSWSSLEKRRAEHEELVKVKIPENSKEIAIARSYGDLSENFEFKAAKQMQSVLMRRKAELEQMLHDARGTSFENPDTSRVSIGTIVTLRNAETNNEETYTILGAWDGDPDRHIISYQTAIGQALLGHAVAETISLNTEEGIAQFIIVSIEPAPPDGTAPARTLPAESGVEAAIAE